jgi:hypothetical protein
MKTVKHAGTLLVSIVLLMLVWGLIEPYTISEDRHEIELPEAPVYWQGREIAVLSDFQVGMWLDNTWTIRRIVKRLVKADPAMVLILGDFIYHGGEDPSGRIASVVRSVRPLSEAGIRTYAVLGNHDYSVVSSEDPRVDEGRAESLRDALEEADVQVMQNEAVRADPLEDPEGLYVVGIGAHMPGKDDPALALKHVPEDAARVVIMHNPDTFADVPTNAANLALAGHTHGGQVRIPFTPQWTWLTYLTEDRIHTDGWIRDYGQVGNRLYVNRGIGFSLLPLRINCPPEITFFRIQGPKDA